MANAILSSLSAKNLFDLTGVVAVVTGGGTGIGLMISTTLVANGATVYLVGPEQGTLDRIAKVYNDAAENDPSRGRMYGIAGDVSKKEEATRLAQVIGEKEKRVTVLFNNAGIMKGPVTRPTEARAAAFVDAYFNAVQQSDFNDVYATNAVGPYWLTFAFLPLLEKWKENEDELSRRFAPQVIMTSSMNGWTKDPLTGGVCPPYIFSKSAIGHATASLAHELLPLGIRVNGIAPGWFDTEMTHPGSADNTGLSLPPADFKVWFDVPVAPRPGWAGKGGSPQDMGSLALFLVANWFVNGETVLIDGGTLLKHPSSY